MLDCSPGRGGETDDSVDLWLGSLSNLWRHSSQQTLAKQRRTYNALLDKELRRLVLGTGWKKRNNSLFQQRDTFFIAAFVVVWLNADKVTFRLNVKPMAVDPIFWAIMDLEANAGESLSFRAWGAFVCGAPPVVESEFSAPLPSAGEMAATFLAWAESRAATFVTQHARRPFSDLIRGHVDQRERQAYTDTLVSALIAEGQLEQAAQVTEEFRSGRQTPVLAQANEETSFLDRAARWLATRAR